MKVLYGIFSIPSPTLRGTIQMDDTFFRECQKGTRHLKNPLPKTANVERKPRYGVRPSLLGSLGPEFASATCAVDKMGFPSAKCAIWIQTFSRSAEMFRRYMLKIYNSS
jgi:hypothetical protein